jgi:hypothetical protein
VPTLAAPNSAATNQAATPAGPHPAPRTRVSKAGSLNSGSSVPD